MLNRNNFPFFWWFLKQTLSSRSRLLWVECNHVRFLKFIDLSTNSVSPSGNTDFRSRVYLSWKVQCTWTKSLCGKLLFAMVKTKRTFVELIEAEVLSKRFKQNTIRATKTVEHLLPSFSDKSLLFFNIFIEVHLIFSTTVHLCKLFNCVFKIKNGRSWKQAVEWLFQLIENTDFESYFGSVPAGKCNSW